MPLLWDLNLLAMWYKMYGVQHPHLLIPKVCLPASAPPQYFSLSKQVKGPISIIVDHEPFCKAHVILALYQNKQLSPMSVIPDNDNDNAKKKHESRTRIPQSGTPDLMPIQ